MLYGLMGIPVSYLVGGLPAVATGALAGIGRRSLCSWQSWLTVSVVGALLTLIFTVAMPMPFGGAPTALAVPAGAIAAYVSAWLFTPEMQRRTRGSPRH